MKNNIGVLAFFSFTLLSFAQENKNLVFESISRSYIQYIPQNYNPNKSYPLVFVLHGFTQNAQTIMNYSDFNRIADENNFIVVYPNGVNNAWNTNYGNPLPGGSTANDVGFILQLIDTLSSQFNINSSRIYSCGFSAGGFMSYRLACEASNHIKAVASVAGTISSQGLSQCNPNKTIPILHIHGTNDFVVNYNGGGGNVSVEDLISFWITHNSCNSNPKVETLPDIVSEGSTVEKYTYQNCSLSTTNIHKKIVSGGHTWPGSTQNSGIGNTNRDINASESIWNFFNLNAISTSTNHISKINKFSPFLYPNPARTHFQIECTNEGRIVLLSFDGKYILEQKVNRGLNTILLNKLSPGIYYVLIYIDSESYSTKLVVYNL
jgi:polyhydroxybutyrate depolymerase